MHPAAQAAAYAHQLSRSGLGSGWHDARAARALVGFPHGALREAGRRQRLVILLRRRRPPKAKLRAHAHTGVTHVLAAGYAHSMCIARLAEIVFV